MSKVESFEDALRMYVSQNVGVGQMVSAYDRAFKQVTTAEGPNSELVRVHHQRKQVHSHLPNLP